MDRKALISDIYYQELGRTDVDQEGLDYWAGLDIDEDQLRKEIRNSAGLAPDSTVSPLLADSTYATFLRNMQLDESTIQSSLAAARESIGRRIQGQAGLYDQQRKQGAKQIDSNYEARQNRSGQRLVDQNENRTSIDANQIQFNSGLQEERSALETNAAQSIADLRRQNVDQQVAARSRLTQRSANL